MPIDVQTTAAPLAELAVTDLKQWVYCRRLLYYYQCLPRVRPVTFKMQTGIEAGRAEEDREERRSLRVYGMGAGQREFNVTLASPRLGLRGEIDMLITLPDQTPVEAIPVDYKLARMAGPHFKLQLAAYAALLEGVRGVTVRRGFLYFIPLRRAEVVAIDDRLRRQLAEALEGMRRVLDSEQMPPPTRHLRKCAACEFRRFCNDAL